MQIVWVKGQPEKQTDSEWYKKKRNSLSASDVGPEVAIDKLEQSLRTAGCETGENRINWSGARLCLSPSPASRHKWSAEANAINIEQHMGSPWERRSWSRQSSNSWRNCRPRCCPPGHHGKPTDRWQHSWATTVTGILHQISEPKINVCASFLSSKSHANFSCGQP